MNLSKKSFPPTVIRASAGTGKTFQLSNRFLGLLAQGVASDTILATTFTRKAAGEILSRILIRLAAAADSKKELASLTKQLNTDQLDQCGCVALLREVINQLHRLHVCTLDSFFSQIARSFSLELKLPAGWQIVDDLTDQNLRSRAIRDLLQNETTEDVLKLVRLLTKGEASRSVSEQITSLVQSLYTIYLEASAEAWHSLPRKKQLSDQELQAAIDSLEKASVPSDKNYLKAHAQALENVTVARWEDFLCKGIGSKILDGSLTYYKKPISGELLEAYEPLVNHAKAVLLGRIAGQNDATWQLLQRFDVIYQRIKNSEHALRFEDVTRKLGEAILAERFAEVNYRMDGHVAHLLLDEFQDTSPLQWQVLRPFAQVVMNARQQKTFFCVGDVKQAIYGWRGGVAEIFEAIDEELKDLQPQLLNQSWRSSPVVMDCVNEVFGSLAANDALQNHSAAAQRWAARYKVHSTVHAEMPGYCRLATAPQAEEDEDPRAITLQYAAQEVTQMHQQKPGLSIGILVRKNDAVARLIYELGALGIHASEEGGNPLLDSPAVELVLSLLKLVDHPGDTIARFHLANSPFAAKYGSFSNAESVLRISREIGRQLAKDGYGLTLYHWTMELAPSCDARDLSRLLQLVEIAYGYEKQATVRTDNFIALVEQQKVADPQAADVRVMTVHQAKGLQFDIVVLPELDVRLGGQTPEIVVGREHATGPIQTVCRYVSKDLRLILPEKFQETLEAHERQVVEESLCLLYVAMTRAVYALHIIIAPSKKNERTIPTTMAGVLRAALVNSNQVPAETLLYEHGNAKWHEAVTQVQSLIQLSPADELTQNSLVVRLAESPRRFTRGLEHRTPSQLEERGRIDLRQKLCWDRSESLDRGSLMHAWFQSIEWLDGREPTIAQLQEIAAEMGLFYPDILRLAEDFQSYLRKPAIRAALSRSTYQCPVRGKADAAVHLQPSMSHPRWEVWREKPFAMRLEECLFSGQIDRVVVFFEGDQAVAADVLDYKTDRIASDDPNMINARIDVYRPQLEVYRCAVAKLLNLDLQMVSARLLFVEKGVVCNV